MATFILVHGAMHGAWCFDRIVPLLQSRGHTVLAPDLPGMGEGGLAPEEVSMALWARTIADLASAQAEKPFLVGHSRGGGVISETAEYAPDAIQGLIYLTAMLLPEGDSLLGGIGKLIDPGRMPPSPPDGYMRPMAGMSTLAFYNRCTAEDAAWAEAQLRPEPLRPSLDPITLTPPRWGSVPRAYIECSDDRAITPDLQRKMQAAAPCEVVIEIDADHSPFLSAPEATVDAIEQAAARLGEGPAA